VKGVIWRGLYEIGHHSCLGMVWQTCPVPLISSQEGTLTLTRRILEARIARSAIFDAKTQLLSALGKAWHLCACLIGRYISCLAAESPHSPTLSSRISHDSFRLSLSDKTLETTVFPIQQPIPPSPDNGHFRPLPAALAGCPGRFGISTVAFPISSLAGSVFAVFRSVKASSDVGHSRWLSVGAYISDNMPNRS
jgi:hypothetical protein